MKKYIFTFCLLQFKICHISPVLQRIFIPKLKEWQAQVKLLKKRPDTGGAGGNGGDGGGGAVTRVRGL